MTQPAYTLENGATIVALFLQPNRVTEDHYNLPPQEVKGVVLAYWPHEWVVWTCWNHPEKANVLVCETGWYSEAKSKALYNFGVRLLRETLTPITTGIVAEVHGEKHST